VALKLRLTRMGSIKNPYYRVVAAESARARDGKFVEILGHYNPRKYPESIVLKEDRVKYWIGQGAQPSPAVKKLMAFKGLLKKEPAEAQTAS
jgi:small subunit ribosomal protein S16